MAWSYRKPCERSRSGPCCHRPVADDRDGLPKAAPKRRQRIFHRHRHGWRDLARHQSVALERPQRLGQHLLGDAADAGAKLGEAQGSIVERQHHQHGPFVGDAPEHLPGGAGVHHHIEAVVHGYPQGTYTTYMCLLPD